MYDDVDPTAMREGELYYDNTESIYRQRHEPWVKNVRRKLEAGTYERKKLVPAMRKYLVPEIDRGYEREFGSKILPNKATKDAMAKRLARKIEYEARQGADYDKPYHQKKGRTFLAAHGFHGYVDKPTRFVAGERGRERVDIEPAKKRKSSSFNSYWFS